MRPLAGVEARAIGEARFKNVASPVALFEFATATCPVRDVAIDPVCRMQVTIGRAAETASHRGRTFHFCSPRCARAFAEAPEKFAGAVGA